LLTRIPDLVNDAVGQLAKLVSNEFELARAELADKAMQAGRAAAMIGAGAIILMPALVVLLLEQIPADVGHRLYPAWRK
jgi:hypothetical protein